MDNRKIIFLEDAIDALDCINGVEEVLRSLPSAQSETHACDLISKASVCEILADIYPTDGEKVVAVKEVDKAYEAIQQLPFAQPDLSSYSDKLWHNAYERGRKEAMEEIIRCKDCKWGDWYTSVDRKRYCYCMETGNGGRTEDDFCSYAERQGK